MKLQQVLVIDNNSVTAQVVDNLLSKTRVIVSTCETAECAKILVKNIEFECILVGDVTDIEWLNDSTQYPYDTINLILYTQQKQILDEQKKKIPRGIPVPISNIYMVLKDFIENK